MSCRGLFLAVWMFVACFALSAGETRVTLMIPSSYGPWTIDDSGQPWVGERGVDLADGSHTIAGALEWKVEVTMGNGEMLLTGMTPGIAGRDLGGLLIYGTELRLPHPHGKKVVLAVHPTAGTYEIPRLLEPGEGDRAVWLPEGETAIIGENWELRLTLGASRKTATFATNDAKLPDPKIEGDIVIIAAKADAVAATPAPVTKLFINNSRTAFLRDETIPLSLYCATALGAKPLVMTDAAGVKTVLPITTPRTETGTRTWNIPAILFRPGTYAFMVDGMPETKLDIFIADADAAEPDAFRIAVVRSADGVAPAGYPYADVLDIKDATPEHLLSPAHPNTWLFATCDLGACVHPSTGELARPLAERALMLTAQAFRKYSGYHVLFAEDKGLSPHAAALRAAAHEPEDDIDFVLALSPRSDKGLFRRGADGVIIPPLGFGADVGALFLSSQADLPFPAGVLAAEGMTYAFGARFVLADTAADAMPAAIAPLLRHLDMAAAAEAVIVAESARGSDAFQNPFHAADACLRAGVGVLFLEPSGMTSAALAGKAVIVPQPITLTNAQKALLTDALAQKRAVLVASGVGNAPAGATVIGADAWSDVAALATALGRSPLPGDVHALPAQGGSVAYRWVMTSASAAETVTLPLPAGTNIAYDVATGESLPVRMTATPHTCDVAVPAGAARLVVFLQAPVKAVNVSARGGMLANTPGVITFEADLVDTGGNRVNGAIPATVTILGKDGAVRHSRKTAFVNGRIASSYTMATNDTDGTYVVRVACALGNASGENACGVTPRPAIMQQLITERTDTEAEDIRFIRKLAKELTGAYVVAGTAVEYRAALRIASAMTDLGIEADACMANEFSADIFDVPDASAAPLPGPATRIARPLILLGSVDTNPLIRQLSEPVHFLPQRIGTAQPYPGAGRVAAMFAWRAFSETHDTVILGVSDAAGLDRAVTWFIRDILNVR